MCLQIVSTFKAYSATMRGVNLSKVSVTVIMPHCDFIAPCKMRDPAAQKVCLVDSNLPKPKKPNIFEKDAILQRTIFQFERFWLDFESSPLVGVSETSLASCSRDDEWYEESQWKVRTSWGWPRWDVAYLAYKPIASEWNIPREFKGQVLTPSFFFLGSMNPER